MAYDFDKIARSYDRLNRVMTFGLDRCWRRRVAQEVVSVQCPGVSVLDVACGTGDMVLELVKRGCTVTGIDLSEEMLAIAERKSRDTARRVRSRGNGLSRTRHAVSLQKADAEHLPFEDDSFDAVTCAFGVRNFVHLEQGLSEMLRVLKPGGRMMILELATPDSAIIRPFYNLYTKRIIPWLGSRIAGSREAYTYLPQSIERFPKGEAFIRIMEKVGCWAVERRLTFGVCRFYMIQKNKEVTA